MYLLNEFKSINEEDLNEKKIKQGFIRGSILGLAGYSTIAGGKYLTNKTLTITKANAKTKAGYNEIKKGHSLIVDAGKLGNTKQAHIKYQVGKDTKQLGKGIVDTYEPIAKKKILGLIADDIRPLNNKKKVVLGLALGASAASIIGSGMMANNYLRKRRKDKGKLRGKYSK